MHAIEAELLTTLRALEQQVATAAASDRKPQLQPLFARIDALASQLPPKSNPSLRHYLQKKSYQKARLCLEERDADNARGSCGSDG